MRKLIVITSPIPAAALISGWLGIITNTNVVRDAMPMPIAIGLFLFGAIGIFRLGLNIQGYIGWGSGLATLAVMAIAFFLILVAPVYLIFTLPTSYMMPAFWASVAAYIATWYVIKAPEGYIK
jgi:hypothetical protein